MKISEFAKNLKDENGKPCRVYRLRDALKKCGFIYSYDRKKKSYEDIKCSRCGEKPYIRAFIGAEACTCEKCKIGMQDITGAIPTGNAVCTVLDLSSVDDWERGKVWMVSRKEEKK